MRNQHKDKGTHKMCKICTKRQDTQACNIKANLKMDELVSCIIPHPSNTLTRASVV
jgi:recombinational DNA repair protein RecR